MFRQRGAIVCARRAVLAIIIAAIFGGAFAASADHTRLSPHLTAAKRNLVTCAPGPSYAQIEYDRGQRAGYNRGWRRGYRDGYHGGSYDATCGVDLGCESIHYRRGFEAGFRRGYDYGFHAGARQREYERCNSHRWW